MIIQREEQRREREEGSREEERREREIGERTKG